MNLSENRQIFQTDVTQSVSGVAERGGIMSYVPGVNGLVAYADATAVSGSVAKTAGLLLDDVEALNYFRHPEYRQRNVVPQGSTVGLVTEGELTTDFVETTLAGISVGTYAPGDNLFLADNGKVSRSNGTFGTNSNSTTTAIRPLVGKALSALDSNNFLKIRVEI
jgi:hypothetical protein